ncbi:LacI family DNA-binding transcriptional regulator [Arthrobacter sp. TMN-50]
MSPSVPEFKVTLNEVARHAGVSAMTASYTYSTPSRVSAASREKVFKAAAALGYPGPDPSARSLRKGTSGALGVVLGETLAYAFDDRQATRFLAGIADVCAENGLAMTILPTNGSADDTQRIRAAAVDAFVVWTTTDDDPVLGALALTGRPTIIHAGPEKKAFGLVGIDDRAAAQAVAAEGLQQAERPAIISFPFTRERSAMITKGPDPTKMTYPVTRNRILGYRDALTSAGFHWADVDVVSCPINSFEAGMQAAARLLDRAGPPDTILAMSDEIALGTLEAARRASVDVPKSLAVTGWDASDTARGKRLTTVQQNLRAQGAACAHAAITGTLTNTPQTWQLLTGQTTR